VNQSLIASSSWSHSGSPIGDRLVRLHSDESEYRHLDSVQVIGGLSAPTCQVSRLFASSIRVIELVSEDRRSTDLPPRSERVRTVSLFRLVRVNRASADRPQRGHEQDGDVMRRTAQ
jgi:hypothetical protein